MPEPIKIAVVGLGTVGTGVVRLLLDDGEHLARHAGRAMRLAKVVVRDRSKPRDIDLPAGILTDNLDAVTENGEIRVVAQLVGGVEAARQIMLRLLDSGKDVVTANKALLAEHGPELFDRARELGRSIAFEASVAGGIPIVGNIGQSLAANQIESLRGILNGTSNFLLSEMDSHGTDYDTALAEAQRRGYAEADPTMDVDGSDAAQKLAILAQLAFGARVAWTEIPRTGIDTLDVTDVRYARELGYRVKLLAVAQLVDDGLELHVSPTLVRVGTPLAEVQGAYNAIRVVGHAVGPVFFHGLGAGQMPTASAVVADLIDTAVGRTAITFRTLGLWSERHDCVSATNFANVSGRYYLRLQVEDHPGVMADVAGLLGRHRISIASILQREGSGSSDQMVPLVIMTNETTEGAMYRACEEIDRLSSTRAPSVRFRVES
ncbi:MAG: homoserine dehydrogenase [Pirellulales bacterium]